MEGTYFISEGAIFQEAEVVKKYPDKAIFRMVLQDVDSPNGNRRIYPSEVLKNGMERCKERMEKRAFLGELDHPLLTGNQRMDMIRQMTVFLKDACQLIRDYEFRGNSLVGELETTSTSNGKTLLGLLIDKIGIGQSMRGLAELEEKEGLHIVKDPLNIFSYDAVSKPSHTGAVVNFNEIQFESNIITESENLICCGDQCFLPEYFDMLVDRKVLKFFKRWV